MAGWVVGLSLVSLLVTIPHVLEDFAYGVPQQIGLGIMLNGIILGVAYFIQGGGIALAAVRSIWGYIISLLVGVGWVATILISHLGELLFSDPYREGTISKGFEVAIIVVGVLLVLASAAAIRRA